jgi:hypothetical protein
MAGKSETKKVDIGQGLGERCSFQMFRSLNDSEILLGWENTLVLGSHREAKIWLSSHTNGWRTGTRSKKQHKIGPSELSERLWNVLFCKSSSFFAHNT